MNKYNIVGISGSLRENSFNTSILKYINENENINFKIINISSIPLFNEDLEENTPKIIIDLKEKLNKADGIIIATPEYNFSIPGGLKNALDWFSRGEVKPFDGKNVAILSASLSFLGGSRVQYHLRNVLLALNSKVLNRPEVFVTNANEKFSESGILIDERTKKSINNLIEELIKEIDIKGNI